MARVEIASMPWGTLQDRAGNALNATTVNLKNLDGTAATTWSAVTGGSSSTAALSTDANGVLSGRFVDAGQYTVDVPSLSITGRRVEAVSGSVETNVIQRAINVKASPYLATGDGTTDDTAAIQAAIDAAEAYANGTVVFLPAGSYKITAPLTIKADNVTLLGAGSGTPKGTTPGSALNPAYGGTVLRAGASFVGAQVVKVARVAADRALHGVFLRDFAINGSSTPAGTDGIYFQAFNSGIERVNVSLVAGDGIIFQGNGATAYPNGAWDNYITNVKVDQVGGIGMSFNSYASDHVVLGCIVEVTGSHGFYFDATSTANMLTGCYVYSCTGKAVLSDNMHQQKFIGCRFQDANGGVYLANTGGTGGFLISGCTFRNSSVTTDNTTDAVNIAAGITTRGGTIIGCDFHTDVGSTNGGAFGSYNRARYGINITSSNMRDLTIGPCTEGYKDAVSCFGTAPLSDSGSNTKLIGLSSRTNATLEIKWGNSVRDLTGSGTPEASVTAPASSSFRRSDGGYSSSLSVKASGTGNTGWAYLAQRALTVNAVDAAFTLTPGTSPEQVIFTAVMAAGRVVTLSTTGAESGMIFKITRTAASTGAFNLDVGGLKNLAVSQWCEVRYNGSAWVLTQFGSL